MFSESTKLKVQQFGRFLSNMVMPNIGAFIAWGFITALFIKTGWFPVAVLGGFGEYEGKGIVGPMITYLLPPAANSLAVIAARWLVRLRRWASSSVQTSRCSSAR